MGVDAWPMQAAVRFNIPLLIYGESIAEHSGKATYIDNPEYTKDYFLKYSALVSPQQMASSGSVAEKDLSLLQWPGQKELDRVGIVRIHLGDFIFWDAERQTEFVRDYLGWKQDIVEGTFKHYKSVECVMPGVHDYTKFLKRGFGRGTDFSVQDVRSGLLTKEEGLVLSDKHDPVKPEILKYYLEITNYSDDEFQNIMQGHRKGIAQQMGPPSEISVDANFEVNDSVKKYVREVREKKKVQKYIDSIQTERLWPTFGPAIASSVEKLQREQKVLEYKLIENPHLLTATQQLRALSDQKLTSYELAQSYLKHIRSLDPILHAWTVVDEENVIRQALLLDKGLQSGQDVGFFSGISVGVKDVFNTADLPTEMGSKTWKGFTPGNDARVIFNLRVAGAVIMGKTETAEFAIHHPPASLNPHDLTRSPGTSSSGSAVAVSSRMCSIALGTQTAGSTIRPASYCGIYGMKPSFGTLPRTGVLKTADTLDNIAFLGLSIDDIAFAFDALRVRGENYPFIHKTLDNKNAQASWINRTCKIGFVKTHLWGDAADYTQEGVSDFVNKLALNGHEVEEINLPEHFQQAHNIHDILYNKSVSYYFDDEYQMQRDLLAPVTREMIEKGQKISNQQYEEALIGQTGLEIKLAEIFNQYDILISHSTAEIAGLVQGHSEKRDPCLMWTLSRVPTINLPVLQGPGNMPLGIQVIAKRYHDYQLLAFCKTLEAQKLTPPIAPLPQLVGSLSAKTNAS